MGTKNKGRGLNSMIPESPETNSPEDTKQLRVRYALLVATQEFLAIDANDRAIKERALEILASQEPAAE